MNKNILRQYQKQISLLLLLMTGVVAVYSLWPYIEFFGNREQIEDLIVSAGVWGPLVYILFQIAQAVIAPIPGSVISVAGGYIFGTLLGTIYNLVGSFIGFYLVFYISKKFGRPLVKYFVKPTTLEKYEEMMNRKGKVFLVIAFLVPVIPDAAVGYIAGLSKLSIPALMTMMMIARLPGVVILNIIGSQAAEANHGVVGIMVLVVAIALVVMYRHRSELEMLLARILKEDTSE